MPAKRFTKHLSPTLTLSFFLAVLMILLNQCNVPEEKTAAQAEDLCEKGRNFLMQYQNDLEARDLTQAARFFREAIAADSTLSEAYSGLGWVYYNRFYWWSEEFLKKAYLDSVLYFSNRSIEIDSFRTESYLLRGKYYSHTGEVERAEMEVNKAIQMDSTFAEAYLTLGYILCHLKQDYVEGFRKYARAISMKKGQEWPPRFYNDLAYGFMDVGAYDEAFTYLQKAIRFQPDVMEPILLSSWLLEVQGRTAEKLDFIDSVQQAFPDSKACISELAYTYASLGKFRESLEYYSMVLDTLEGEARIPMKLALRLGYVYWNLGDTARADKFFNDQINYSKESLAVGKGYQTAEYDLAAVYAFTGKLEEALDYLKCYADKGFTYGLHDYVFRDPLFRDLHQTPGFNEIMEPVLQRKKRMREQLVEMNLISEQ